MPGVTLTTSERLEYYTAPGSYTSRIESGTRYVRIWVQAAGGGGRGRTSPPVDGSAGGGGGFAFIEREVISSDWDADLTLVVGDGVVNAAGGNSTVSGTLNGASVSVTANGGGAGTNLVDGAGGTASGGDTNLTGESGSGYTIGPPGEETPGTAGRAGGVYNGGSGPFAGALDYQAIGPGHGGLASNANTAGQPGYIILRWL